MDEPWNERISSRLGFGLDRKDVAGSSAPSHEFAHLPHFQRQETSLGYAGVHGRGLVDGDCTNSDD